MRRLLIGLVSVLVLLSEPAQALAIPFDPAEASLTADDVPPGYELDLDNTGSAEYGPVDYFQAAFRRSTEGVVDGTITVVIGLSQVGPIAGLLENTMGGMLGYMGEGGQAAVPTDGPAIGERSYWYALSLEEDGVLYDGYAVGFVQSDGIAIVSLGGFAGQVAIEQAADLASIIAGRLFNPNR